jgi:hypothetical protein
LPDEGEPLEGEAVLERQARQAALRADVGTALSGGGALQNVLQRCAEAMVRHLDAAFARIWTLNEEEGLLELQASAGIYTHLDGPHSRDKLATPGEVLGTIRRLGGGRSV